jgi:hypothetical protein
MVRITHNTAFPGILLAKQSVYPRYPNAGGAMTYLLALLACNGGDPVDTARIIPPPLDPAIIAQFDPHKIKAHTEVLAASEMGGRVPGSFGSEDARNYIEGVMIEIGLEPLGADGGYVFPYPNSAYPGRYQQLRDGSIVEMTTDTGYNLVGVLPGSDPALSDEYMVVMAHYDHLGVEEDGTVYNGAFDNAAAVGMNLEIARVLIENNAAPGRSTIFLFTDDEETGLDGADAWINASTVPIDDIVFGVSTDPLGRRMLPDFAPIVLIGGERSPALEDRWREAATFVDSPIYFIHRDVIPIFASDQDEFYKAVTPVPAVWFTNIGFAFYHTTNDTADTIDYRMILDDAEFLAQALTLIGADDQRYDYDGPFEPAGAAAEEASRLLNDMLKSKWPNTADRELADFYLTQLQWVIDADSQDVLDNPEVLYTATLYFLLFDMSLKYVGEIPPPWPEGW